MEPLVTSCISTPVLPKPFFSAKIVDIEGFLRLTATKQFVEMGDAVCGIDAGDFDGLTSIGIVIVNRDCELLDIVDIGCAAHRQRILPTGILSEFVAVKPLYPRFYTSGSTMTVSCLTSEIFRLLSSRNATRSWRARAVRSRLTLPLSRPSVRARPADRLGVLLAQAVEQFGSFGREYVLGALAVEHVHVVESRRGERSRDFCPLFGSISLYRHWLVYLSLCTTATYMNVATGGDSIQLSIYQSHTLYEILLLKT